MSKLDLAFLTDDVCERSDGNPGAIQVMCTGIIELGPEFFLRIERANLRGPEIWRVFKDEHGGDISKMHEALA